jgi:hypothetical protein
VRIRRLELRQWWSQPVTRLKTNHDIESKTCLPDTFLTLEGIVEINFFVDVQPSNNSALRQTRVPHGKLSLVFPTVSGIT